MQVEYVRSLTPDRFDFVRDTLVSFILMKDKDDTEYAKLSRKIMLANEKIHELKNAIHSNGTSLGC